MNKESSEELNAEQCPLCRQPNQCQLCTESAYKGPCWCLTMKIPDALLAQVPPNLRSRSCICRACVMDFHRRQITTTHPLQPEDFYFDPGGLLVLTAEYLLRRGFCCCNGCRHCPYKN